MLRIVKDAKIESCQDFYRTEKPKIPATGFFFTVYFSKFKIKKMVRMLCNCSCDEYPTIDVAYLPIQNQLFCSD